MVDKHKKATIGYAEIYLTEKSAYLGRILIGVKNLRGKGMGQIIVHQLLVFAFHNLKQSQVELNVFDWNISAIKCYEKVGFLINTHKRKERKVNGHIWTALNMTMDKQKWMQLQQA